MAETPLTPDLLAVIRRQSDGKTLVVVKRGGQPMVELNGYALPGDVSDYLRHGVNNYCTEPQFMGTSVVADDGLTYGLTRIPDTARFVLGCMVDLPLKRRPAIPRGVRDAVIERDGGRCRHCGSPDDIQLDHIKPWSRGGSDTADNLQCLCGTCNRKKWHSDKVIP